MKINKINTNKKAVSEMISYVILIAIAIGISIGVFIWLKDYANISRKIDCKEGSSLILESYSVQTTSLNLTLRNNGNFNISGFIMSVGNDTKKIPIKILISFDAEGDIRGHYSFSSPLKPGAIKSAAFSKDSDYYIKVIQIQPYIKDEKGKIIICESALIKQEI